jgi:pyruvate dehydrogenase E2 component (dihydrolipoamide acetyltransferase)
MPFEVVMPRLGWNMETGRLGEWLKKEGEHVEAGELLFTVESDKAVQEVEALESGTLRIPADAPPPGEEVAVGTLLGYLLAEGEHAPFAAPAQAKPGSLPATAESQAAEQGTGQAAATTDRQSGEPAISPRARRIAREMGVNWSGLEGSGRTGRIVERDVRQAAATQRFAERISPLARRLAGELGVDVDRLAAQMPGKRIERADVEAAAVGATTPAPVVMTAPAPAAWSFAPAIPVQVSAPAQAAGTVLPISSMRRTIAERMATSAHTVAPVTLTTEADATELVRLRNQLKSDGVQPAPSYNDLLAKLSAQALLEHPAVNARFEGENGIVEAATANIGIAVDTERGLLVPVLRDVQAKNLRQIARESLALIERTRAGRAGPDDLRGGTFTITNLGMFEIDAFTPIINLPECAILGVGRIVPKQVVVDVDAERVAIRHMMFLSLTFDHRLVDGAPAARFLQRVKQYIEKPYLWLVG